MCNIFDIWIQSETLLHTSETLMWKMTCCWYVHQSWRQLIEEITRNKMIIEVIYNALKRKPSIANCIFRKTSFWWTNSNKASMNTITRWSYWERAVPVIVSYMQQQNLEFQHGNVSGHAAQYTNSSLHYIAFTQSFSLQMRLIWIQLKNVWDWMKD